MGNGELLAFPPIEMDFSGLKEGSLKVMDNSAKFDEKSDRFHGTKAVVATIEPELKAKLQKASIDAYRALRVCDYGRVDLRLTEAGEVYVIEVNASCYLEEQSEFATAAAAHGIPYPELVERIAELAVERWKHRHRAQKRRKKARTAAAATG
jgi:D-alanine-D-alanine ligase